MGLLPKTATMSARRLQLQEFDFLTLGGQRELSAIRGDRLGMIFQDPMTSLNPVYTVGNQMMEVYTRHGKGGRNEARERAAYLLDKVGITAVKERLKQYPHQLSGGLRQRVMIGMMLMCDPILLIADEPTTALDVTIQAQILNLLAGLQEEFAMGLIMITHDLGVIARISDKVAVMYAGRIVEAGTTEEVFAAPTHPYTHGLLECIPVPGKHDRGSPLGSIRGIVPSLIGEMEGCEFQNRCPHLREGCTKGVIKDHVLGPGRTYRCLMDQAEALEKYKDVHTGAFA
jgi:peptide/nickel transport system ATP-binding protein